MKGSFRKRIRCIECGASAHPSRSADDDMNRKTEIYMCLLDEGTDVWRPVQALDLGNDLFRIVSENPDPEDEHWQFSTGDMVRCKSRFLADSKVHMCLVAVERVEDTAEHRAERDSEDRAR